jgi:hypothetical protein
MNTDNTQNPNNPGQTVFNQIEFRYIDRMKGEDIKIMVHANNNMTVKDLIKNFRAKLCDDTIIIQSYILDDSTYLDPFSEAPITQFGIGKNSVIKAIKQ